MKKDKMTLCLLMVLCLSIFALTRLPSPARAQVTEIEFLNHWTEPSEVYYWANVTKEYNEHYAPSGYQIKMTSVEFDILYDTIMTRHIANSDPDIISMHAMWIPTFANWRTAILSVPPADVQANVKANWTQVTVAGSTYKGIVWGFPTEFNSWGLVYNKELLQAGGYSAPPATWTDLESMAIALTQKDATGKFIKSGFVPFVEGAPEEQRYQFMSLLWSNGGEFVDLNAPKVLFNSTNGLEVMQLYNRLGFGASPTYDHLNFPDYWWNAWVDESIAMIILPTWMTYVRDAMGDNFSHLAIAPIPVGPHGTGSKSATYNWMLGVTQKAQNEGKANAAWDFLRWINKERPQYDLPLPGATSIGAVPKGNGATIMGDYLIRDSILPSAKCDQANGRLTVVVGGVGQAGPLISDDFWFKGFMDLGAPPYGRSDQGFLKIKEVQYEIGQMFEKVTLTGADPMATMTDTATKVQAMLPMPGDINIDGVVDIYDAVNLIKDIDAIPGSVNWNRGRSDITNDNRVSGADATILSVNYGKTGGY